MIRTSGVETSCAHHSSDSHLPWKEAGQTSRALCLFSLMRCLHLQVIPSALDNNQANHEEHLERDASRMEFISSMNFDVSRS